MGMIRVSDNHTRNYSATAWQEGANQVCQVKRGLPKVNLSKLKGQ